VARKTIGYDKLPGGDAMKTVQKLHDLAAPVNAR
jgi:hypothetical protein